MQLEGRPEQAARAGTASTSPAAALLEALLAVPDLATPEDREQLAGITALAALLQELAASATAADRTAAPPPPRSPVPDFLKPLLPAQVRSTPDLRCAAVPSSFHSFSL